MNVRMFTLCDGAYNYNGKLTIVGTIDNIKVSHTPITVSVGIAVKVTFAPNEYGKKKVKLKFVNAQGTSIIPDMELPETMASSKNNEEAKLVVAGNLQGLKFEQEGIYRVQLCVNDEIHELPFSVLR